MNMEVDWASGLVADIAYEILDNLLDPKDDANFGAVCRNWRLFRKGYIRKQALLPMLLVPNQLDYDLYSRTERSLYSICSGKVYDTGLSVFDKVRYCGSSHGWLVTVEEKTVIVLLNPFIRDSLIIRLPPLDFRAGAFTAEYNIHKVILTVDPIKNPDSYIVVAIYGSCGQLAFYNSSHKSWAYIRPWAGITDVIMYKGLAYAIKVYGNAIKVYGNDIISFDVTSSSEPWGLKHYKSRKPTALQLVVTSSEMPSYLVESSEGELLQVERYIDLSHTKITKSFEVFKLQFVEEKGCEGLVDKVEVKSLGNDVIFLGENHSFVVPIKTYKSRLCRPNSIFYTGEYICVSSYENHKDVGCFNFADKTFQRYYKYHPFREWNKQIPNPMWVTPSLQ